MTAHICRPMHVQPRRETCNVGQRIANFTFWKHVPKGYRIVCCWDHRKFCTSTSQTELHFRPRPYRFRGTNFLLRRPSSSFFWKVDGASKEQCCLPDLHILLNRDWKAFKLRQLYISNFQFLLRQAVTDDEASTRVLQILLFLFLSTASLMFIPCAARSSFTLSIHFFGCLPLLLVPSTCPYSSTAGSLLPSRFVTCPSHVSLLFLILDIYRPIYMDFKTAGSNISLQ